MLLCRAIRLPTRSCVVQQMRTLAGGSSSIMSPPPMPSPQVKPFMEDEHTHFTPEELATDLRTGQESIYKLGKHRSNALELVHRIPITEVDGDLAICDGGGGALGHPLEYISLEVPGSVEYCKYCALRYTKKKKH